MKLNRQLVREFLEKSDWATPKNICYLLQGNTENYKQVDTDLEKMANLKRSPSIKRLLCNYGKVYAKGSTRKKRVGKNYEHDAQLRDCVAKFIHTAGGLQDLDFEPPSDARIGNIYFEFDNGGMTTKSLKEKIEKHYMKPGAYQVIFIMAWEYKDHWRLREQIRKGEERRLRKLLELAKEIFPGKPNRILGATYHGFLEDGNLITYKTLQ